MDLLVQGIDERKVRNIVVKELKEFKALRIAMENKKEIEEEGIEILFPMLNNEKEKIIKFKQINRAINEALDEIEREIIDKKYLSTTRVKDIELYLDMGITKDRYYMYKKQAIFQIAKALRII